MQHDAPSSPDDSLPASQTAQSLQNQIAEYNKSQPPPRKQNTACDACRHLIQQATSEKKRNASIGRRPRNSSSAAATKYAVLDPSGKPSAVLGRFAEPPSPRSSSILDNSAAMAPPPIPNSPNIPLGVKYGFRPHITLATTTRDLLSYIFAPPEPNEDQYSFPPVPGRRPSPYDIWGNQAFRLEDDNFKAEFTLDLVEVFFQIVHTRLPLLNPAQFRDRLQLHPSASSNNKDPLHPALVATVLAWGTKFSEHPLLVADRQRPSHQSLLAKTLIDRARDLGEALKVHRIPKTDHVVIGLLIEPLQSQIADDPTGMEQSTVVPSVTTDSRLSRLPRILADGGNASSSGSTSMWSCTSNLGSPDPESRAMMVFAWWMACFCDAYASAYYRRKPVLDDGDYDIDFYTGDPIIAGSLDAHGRPLQSPREQLEALVGGILQRTEGYYGAAHSLARTARNMSRQLWKPVTDAEGIPLETLHEFTLDLSAWREKYLSTVGVPSNFKGEWDFVSAVSSCASDATYHVMWIILFNALDDFGVKEINNRAITPNNPRIEEVKRKVLEEALHGALRISGLRLDPAVMHVSCIQAGTLLARMGNENVRACINGLKQYSHSYEEAGEQAAEMQRVYEAALAGEPQFSHMGAAVPTRTNPEGTSGDDQDMEMLDSRHQHMGWSR
ncbi:hypothetical protein C0995_003217 [Termitomyces sp. Mi166|nr:hypothetical protein C0995_003217 [Termitomyces sp. Mi166\